MKAAQIVREAGRYYYKLDGKISTQSFTTMLDCQKAYIKAYIAKYPKYKPLVEGKNWEQIMRIFGMRASNG